jgi:hypothetical protein
MTRPAGEWCLIVNGSRVEEWRNGKKVAEYETDSKGMMYRVQANEVKVTPRASK